MSNVTIVALVAAVTVGSRVIAIALLPTPRGRLAEIVDRLPAPLFAVLAALTTLGGDRTVDIGVFGGILAAVLAAPSRSLLPTVVAGLAGALLFHTLA